MARHDPQPGTSRPTQPQTQGQQAGNNTTDSAPPAQTPQQQASARFTDWASI